VIYVSSFHKYAKMPWVVLRCPGISPTGKLIIASWVQAINWNTLTVERGQEPTSKSLAESIGVSTSAINRALEHIKRDAGFRIKKTQDSISICLYDDLVVQELFENHVSYKKLLTDAAEQKKKSITADRKKTHQRHTLTPTSETSYPSPLALSLLLKEERRSKKGSAALKHTEVEEFFRKHFSITGAIKLFGEYPADLIAVVVKCCIARIKDGNGDIKNPAGWVSAAIQSPMDYPDIQDARKQDVKEAAPDTLGNIFKELKKKT